MESKSNFVEVREMANAGVCIGTFACVDIGVQHSLSCMHSSKNINTRAMKIFW